MAASQKQPQTRDYAYFYLNGVAHTVRGQNLFLNLSDYLRVSQGLTGTKVVCSEGDCGACSVLRAFPKPLSKETPRFEAINSCIIRVGQMDGSSLVTVEALRKLVPDQDLHPVQKAMVECHGSQCGFCTPGFVVTLAGAIDKKTLNTAQEVKNELTGNLCRCTGYLPIIESALAINKIDKSKLKKLNSVFMTKKIENDLREVQKKSLLVREKNICFEAPSSKKDLSLWRKKNPQSILLAAGTDLGVAANKGRIDPKYFLSLHLLPELYVIKQDSKQLQIGARVTLSEFRKKLQSNKTLASFLHVFASPQIKNFGTVVGNVANASPIGDTPPLLLALDAEVEIFSSLTQKTRWVPLCDFYKAYKVTDLKKGEIIWSLRMKMPSKKDRFLLTKISQRRDLDISCVNTGFYMRLGAVSSQKKLKPESLRLALGGVGPIPLRLWNTENFLMNEGLSEETLPVALDLAQQEIAPLTDLRGSANYRRLVSHGLLKKFFSESLAEALKS
jgi:xanthine dehydrogenase small subunit